MDRVRVRYAPSPTGNSHIGGARSALFNYLYAKHNGGDFVFRSEDTDIARNIPGGEDSQIDNLIWLGIIPDESPRNPGKYGPYRQMERLDLYNEWTKWLLDHDYAYRCYCTHEELDAEHERQTEAKVAPKYSGHCAHLTPEQIAAYEAEGREFVIRLRCPEDVIYRFKDLVRGDVSFESNGIGDWVIVKANGIPTYNYAVVVDDHFMEISHVFRGEEHLSNTPKQIMLFNYFGWEVPTYGHMTLVVNEERKKLSKRDESIMQFVSQYKDQGYLPDAMFNFFALLGWSPEGEEEIFTHDQLIELFDVNRLSKSPSMFDKQKLTWINNRYIKDRNLEDVVALCKPFLEKAYDLSDKSDEWVSSIIALYHDQLSYGAEIVELSKLFFDQELPELPEEAKEILEHEDAAKAIAGFKEEISKVEDFTAENIKAAIKATQVATGVKGKMLFMPIRIATTGIMHGPDLASSLMILGKDKVLTKLS